MLINSKEIPANRNTKLYGGVSQCYFSPLSPFPEARVIMVNTRFSPTVPQGAGKEWLKQEKEDP